MKFLGLILAIYSFMVFYSQRKQLIVLNNLGHLVILLFLVPRPKTFSLENDLHNEAIDI